MTILPRWGERRGLDRAGVERAQSLMPAQLDVVGVRRVAALTKLGAERVFEINPDSYQCRRLAAQMADQWVQVAAGQSESAVSTHRQALCSYLSFVASQGCVHIALDRDPDAVASTLSAWTKSLLEKYGAQSKVPYRLANIVQTQMILAVEGGIITDSSLSALAMGPSLVARPPERPLDAFGEAELKQMILAARAHVRALRVIRRWAQETIEAYGHGQISDRGKRTIAQMLASAASGLPICVPPAPSNVDPLAYFPAEAWALYRPPNAPENSVPSAKAWCIRAVMPAAIDLVPFHVLLLAETGVAAEEISSLRLSGIDFQAEGVRLQLTKGRAARSKGRFFPASAVEGRWDVPGVMKALLEYTEPARALMEPEIRDWLWLAVDPQRSNGEYRHLPRPLTHFPPDARLTIWLGRVGGLHEVGEVSTPHDLRRIRKAKLSERAIALKGMFADIAGDEHTTRVFYTHYAHTTALKVYSASVISRFQRSLADAVSSGFTAFLEQRSAVPLTAITEALPIETSHALTLTSGDLDMGIADCRDPFDSPFTAKGKLCASAPLSCLICQNAVVFTDHLPNILALIESMERIRTSMNPEEWITIWGAQYNAAHALIESLPDSVREAARQRMDDARTDLPSWLQRGAE